MDEGNVQQILTELLYCAVNEIGCDAELNEKLTPEVLASVYQLAKAHALSHLVSGYLFTAGIKTEPILAEELGRQEMLAVYTMERQKYSFGQICEAFEHEKIPYLPLKGSVLRPYYPDGVMRTSCDIDVLVHEEDLDAAIRALEEKGFRRDKRQFHDVWLYSPNGTHLELHFSVLENLEQLDRVLARVWEYAKPAEGYRYELKKEFFVFYMYAHTAYHLLTGGCGIRSLMDLWIMEHRMQAPYGCARALLEEAGIYRFAEEMSGLANKCFTERRGDDPLLSYIWRGGVYGSVENQVAVQKHVTRSRFVYLLKRLFLPYKFMVILYPGLKKVPILLPVYWVRRWIRAILDGKTAHYASEISALGNVSQENLSEIKEIRQRLGL